MVDYPYLNLEANERYWVNKFTAWVEADDMKTKIFSLPNRVSWFIQFNNILCSFTNYLWNSCGQYMIIASHSKCIIFSLWLSFKYAPAMSFRESKSLAKVEKIKTRDENLRPQINLFYLPLDVDASLTL